MAIVARCIACYYSPWYLPLRLREGRGLAGHPGGRLKVIVAMRYALACGEGGSGGVWAGLVCVPGLRDACEAGLCLSGVIVPLSCEWTQRSSTRPPYSPHRHLSPHFCSAGTCPRACRHLTIRSRERQATSLQSPPSNTAFGRLLAARKACSSRIKAAAAADRCAAVVQPTACLATKNQLQDGGPG